MTATGQIVYTDIDDFEKESFNLKPIKTNIQKLIKYSEFFSSSGFGVKDILINKNDVYDETNDNDFEINQDIDYESEIKSPGWIRYQKKLK